METLPKLELLNQTLSTLVGPDLFTIAVKADCKGVNGDSISIYKKGKVQKAFVKSWELHHET